MKINKEVELSPIQVGKEKTLRLFANLRGWYTADTKNESSRGGAALRLTPTAAVVEDDVEIYQVEMFDLMANSLRKMVFAGLVMSALCSLIMILGRNIISRRYAHTEDADT